MVSIYLIEDINDLKYVGSTTQELNVRFSQHRSDKKNGANYCSSKKLNLYNSIITELECCNEENRKDREQYWINKLDCVNEINALHDKKQCEKNWRENNKEKKYQKDKQYRENNKDKIKEYRKLEWYCSDCKCNVKKCHKSRHLKSQKHKKTKKETFKEEINI